MRKVLLSVALCSLAAGATLPARAEVRSVDASVGTAVGDAIDTTGAATPLPALSWGRVQGRVAFATHTTPLRPDFQGSEAAFKVSSLSLLGDYYLRPSLSQLTLGGLRATGGLLLGQRNGLWGLSSTHLGTLSAERRGSALAHDPFNAPSTDFGGTAPYLGIGYSTTGSHIGRNSWGFTADLGVMSLSPGAMGRAGRVVSGSQNLDDMVRDLRLSPVLQFGFTYSF